MSAPEERVVKKEDEIVPAAGSESDEGWYATGLTLHGNWSSGPEKSLYAKRNL